MMNEREFETLLERQEDETIDFKAKEYNLSSDFHKFALIKDVLCMCNTPRESNSYIVLGVEKHADGSYDLLGLNRIDDESIIQSQFSDRVSPIPRMKYEIVIYKDKKYGIIIIPPDRIGPCVPIRDYGERLRRRQVYIRRGSKNDAAAPEDLLRILSWISGKERHEGEDYLENIEVNTQWEKFMRSVNDFESSRTYILAISPQTKKLTKEVESLGLINWSLVLDFDPDSDDNGILKSCKPRLSEISKIHVVTMGEKPIVNIGFSTYWFFARGLTGRQQTIEEGNWKAWNQKYGNEVREQLITFARTYGARPVNLVAIWNQVELADHLQSLFESAMTVFGDTLTFTIITDNPSYFENTIAKFDPQVCNIPLHQLCTGLSHRFKIKTDEKPESICLPSKCGVPEPLDRDTELWISEELTLMHLKIGDSAPNNRQIPKEFLKGNEILWFELGLHIDIDRDKTAKVTKAVKRDLSQRRSTRINLYHKPGAGGTTIGKRILWDFHQNYPCAILKSTEPEETAERISKIVSLTLLPMLIMVDGSDISSNEIERLYEVLRAHHLPVVMLSILRRFKEQEEGERSFNLESTLSIAEAERFRYVLTKENPQKEFEINQLARTGETIIRTAFHFGLTAFGKDYVGLEKYIEDHLLELDDIQKRILAFVAFAHHYSQQALPIYSLRPILRLQGTKRIDIHRVFPESAFELLAEPKSDCWRTSHDLIALELLKQITWPSKTDRRQWHQNLSTWAIDFIDFCRGVSPIPSEELMKIVRRVFVFRDNMELLGTERSAREQFSQLIEDIPSPEGRLHILKYLTETFPGEAHFWAHLGRFYSIQMRDHENAILCIDKSIALQYQDHVLYHIKGMSIRKSIYGVIDRKGLIEDIITMAKDASEAFQTARKLAPDDPHGYISEVQMILKILDYAGTMHKDGAIAYISNKEVDPYLRESIDLIEDLLSQVRRNREGEGISKYEEECLANIDSIYGRHERALEIMNNMLTRREVYGPPIRRQIVWTYLARRERSWDKLEQKDVNRIVSLLEDNLQEEPDNEKNLRIWVQAVRRLSSPPSIENIIEKVGYWRVNTDSLDSTYYLYTLYALQSLEGYTLARDEALRILDECRHKSKLRRNRTYSFEWLGYGLGIQRLVHQTQLGEWNRKIDFWNQTEPLSRVEGRISKINGPQAGLIEVEGGLEAFFVPSKSGHSKGESENKQVSFYLGFSYDGLRAWEIKDKD